jgi:hypothetical protein
VMIHSAKFGCSSSTTRARSRRGSRRSR